MKYMAKVGGDNGTTHEGTAEEVAEWLASWTGGSNLWADVYRGEDLVYVGVTLEHGHRETTCKVRIVHDDAWRDAMRSAAAREQA
jgi:hypothetical protein